MASNLLLFQYYSSLSSLVILLLLDHLPCFESMFFFLFALICHYTTAISYKVNKLAQHLPFFFLGRLQSLALKAPFSWICTAKEGSFSICVDRDALRNILFLQFFMYEPINPAWYYMLLVSYWGFDSSGSLWMFLCATSWLWSLSPILKMFGHSVKHMMTL